MRPSPSVQLVLVIPGAVPQSAWADKKPRPGDRIQDYYGQSWRVGEILQSGRATYTVICEPTSSSLAAVPELASELLGRARKAVSLSKRKRRSRRRRGYIP